MTTERVTLAVDLHGQLPTEFRLFKAGWNPTEKGAFLFDAVAAKAVMAAYAKWGVDLAIDLEHQMLDVAGADPDSRDARGWFQLELRRGDLWAVRVRWTSDGAQRLRSKRQRYVSPAFEIDTETKRITKVVNCALTALPATHKTPALIAASMRGVGLGTRILAGWRVARQRLAGPPPDPADTDELLEVHQLMEQALEAIGKEDAPAALKLVKQIVDTTTDADSKALAKEAQAALEAADLVAAGDFLAKIAEGGATPEPEPAEAEMRTALRVGSTSARQVLAWRRDSIALHRERAGWEAQERDALAVRVAHALGPAVAWEDPLIATTSRRRPAEPYASMSLEQLRTHVESLSRGKVLRLSGDGSRPPSGHGEYVTETARITLSERELAHCKARNINPAKYAEVRAAIVSRTSIRD